MSKDAEGPLPDPDQDKKVPLWTEIAGWYGAMAIMAAYMIASFGWASAEGWAYQLLNITGAAGLLVIGWVKGVRQNVMLNLFWILIGLVAIYNLVR